MTNYEKRLEELGLTTALKSRLHSEDGFECGACSAVSDTKEKAYVDEDAPMKIERPPLEDLTHLNPTARVTPKEVQRSWWRGLSKEEKERRLKKMSVWGKEGGKATKNRLWMRGKVGRKEVRDTAASLTVNEPPGGQFKNWVGSRSFYAGVKPGGS